MVIGDTPWGRGSLTVMSAELSPPLEISPLRLNEIEAAASLWEACGLTRPCNDPIADARRALAGGTSTIIAGRLAERLAATAMVGAEGHRAWVYYLAVAHDLRGHGYGAAMMQAAEGFAKDHGMPKLQLMVRQDNADALGFYASIGYRQEPVNVLSRRFEDAGPAADCAVGGRAGASSSSR
jgi:ribosomal protein S18 acetylase RimI-like enzyme